jgi:murein DD-endopeptidase MepM/ murein hydrolase activator NlpD
MAAYAGLPFDLAQAANVPAEDSIPLDLMETFRWERYNVRRGDTVSSIAAARGLTLDTIIAVNSIANVKQLREGLSLRIPNMDGIPYTVRRGDSLSKISASWGIPMEAILDANDLDSDVISPGASLFLPGARMNREDLKKALGYQFKYPIRGRLTSGYGWRSDPFTGIRRFHAAIDLAANRGTPIYAATDGRVSTQGVSSVYGKYIILTHSGGYQSMYAHLDAFSVSSGAGVVQGSRIGTVGNTGYSTGPHLHFALFKNGKAVNPLEYLSR